MKIAIGCDPNAQEAKEELIVHINRKGYGAVTDFGSEDTIYAHVAIKVAEEVAAKKYDCGILICGTGIGVSLAANKVRGLCGACIRYIHGAESETEQRCEYSLYGSAYDRAEDQRADGR